MITADLSVGTEGGYTERLPLRWSTALIEAVADRVLEKIRCLPSEGEFRGHLPFAGRDGASGNDTISFGNRKFLGITEVA